MKRKRRNPFWIPFICCAVVSCIIIGVALFYVFIEKNYEMEKQYYQEKIGNVLDDLSFQLEVFEKIALHISINNKYQPLQLAKQKYSENELLNDFVQYQHYSVLTDELFIYYNNNKNLFHVSGNTIDIDVYTNSLTGDDKKTLLDRISELGNDQDIVLCGEDIYILTPIHIYDAGKKVKAVLVSVVEMDNLKKRFEIVSGGLDGSIALYNGEERIYCDGEEFVTESTKGVYEAVDSELAVKLFYKPDKRLFFSLERFLVQIMLILADILLVITIAGLFARNTYKPLLKISEKYRDENMLPDALNSGNALEEIDNILDATLKNCVTTAQRLEQQQELLKRQILRMLLNGAYLLDVKQYLEKLNISIPGPFFYVISILLPEYAMEDGMLSKLQKEVEELTSEEDAEYLYAVYSQENGQLWVICSLEDSDKEKEITEYVKETIESFIDDIQIGVGNVYGSLGKISASWLESMDNLIEKTTVQGEERQGFTYTAESQKCIMDALSRGAQDEALQELGKYTAYLKENQLSLLMRQYIFTEFVGEISKLSKKYKVDLSYQILALIILSKSIDSFYETAHTLICEFCRSYGVVMESKMKEGAEVVCRYITNHCAEYDLSVEKVAAELGITGAIVRDTVYETTGKNFRNYVVFLRVEYAKRLLIEEKLSVYEVGQKIGYSSVSHFIKIFKEETGQTPAKYVKENMTEWEQ